MIGDGEGAPVLPWDPTELTGEGLGDMGDGVPVLLEKDVNYSYLKDVVIKNVRVSEHTAGKKMEFLTANLMSLCNLLSTGTPRRWVLGSF